VILIKIEIILYYRSYKFKIIMASASYAANKCSNCHIKISDGIIRKSKFYCNTACYDAVKKVHFSTGVRPSSIVATTIPAALPPVVIKKCNYCFDTFEKHACPGIYYGHLWFCSNYHLQLANPRPASGPVIMRPSMGHLRIISGPVMGPFGPIGGPLGPVMGPFGNSFF
jgi:hypothetical protein